MLKFARGVVIPNARLTAESGVVSASPRWAYKNCEAPKFWTSVHTRKRACGFLHVKLLHSAAAQPQPTQNALAMLRLDH
jgi:hypothetical protein